MEIGGNTKGVGKRLSNFTARMFSLDGIACNSMEGLLQSFKSEIVLTESEFCKRLKLT